MNAGTSHRNHPKLLFARSHLELTASQSADRMLGKALLLSATLLLLHAACMTYDHVSHLKALVQPEAPVPLNTLYESILALVLGILGASMNSPALRDITWASEMKKRTIDDMDARSGLASYVSRGKLFHDQRGASRPT